MDPRIASWDPTSCCSDLALFAFWSPSSASDRRKRLAKVGPFKDSRGRLRCEVLPAGHEGAHEHCSPSSKSLTTFSLGFSIGAYPSQNRVIKHLIMPSFGPLAQGQGLWLSALRARLQPIMPISGCGIVGFRATGTGFMGALRVCGSGFIGLRNQTLN